MSSTGHPLVRAFVAEHTSEEDHWLVRERSASNVRGHYESADHLATEYESRGLAEVFNDIVSVADWASETGDDRSWLMALRRVLEQETMNLSHRSHKRETALFLQQIAWRYRDIGHPQQAEALEAIL